MFVLALMQINFNKVCNRKQRHHEIQDVCFTEIHSFNGVTDKVNKVTVTSNL